MTTADLSLHLSGPRSRRTWWSASHAGRGGAAGWALGALSGLVWALLTVAVSWQAALVGYAVGAAAGTLVGALTGGGVGAELRARRGRHGQGFPGRL